MPNMPTAHSAMTAFAPATLRERNRRSGISGSAIRAWRATKRPAAGAHAAQHERPRRAPAVLLDPEDRVDAEHQARGEQRGAGEVGARAERRCPAGPRRPEREQRGRDADRHVDEEDPVPVDRLGQRAAGEQADRAAGRRDEAVDADRLGLLARLREHRHDDAEDDGGGDRAADALHEARRDQHARALRQRAQQRGDGEEGDAGTGTRAAGRRGRRPGRRAAAGRRTRSGTR